MSGSGIKLDNNKNQLKESSSESEHEFSPEEMIKVCLKHDLAEDKAIEDLFKTSKRNILKKNNTKLKQKDLKPKNIKNIIKALNKGSSLYDKKKLKTIENIYLKKKFGISSSSQQQAPLHSQQKNSYQLSYHQNARRGCQANAEPRSLKNTNRFQPGHQRCFCLDGM